jgi:hypothetical protein
MADFTWCMTAIDRGFPIEETATKLPEVSEKGVSVSSLGMKNIRSSLLRTLLLSSNGTL